MNCSASSSAWLRAVSSCASARCDRSPPTYDITAIERTAPPISTSRRLKPDDRFERVGRRGFKTDLYQGGAPSIDQPRNRDEYGMNFEERKLRRGPSPDGGAKPFALGSR